ncbi:hypothetical protein DFJ77DRAFT_512453 [Powellomyces hirtus]|nr:hypothetical protein DFJ77DRAFT_515695 [Powellomyces hirtus]KAI8910513.1 hypothetical protein DFJ77DRAFT_512453 [Powellomyces hirtus]
MAPPLKNAVWKAAFSIRRLLSDSLPTRPRSRRVLPERTDVHLLFTALPWMAHHHQRNPSAGMMFYNATAIAVAWLLGWAVVFIHDTTTIVVTSELANSSVSTIPVGLSFVGSLASAIPLAQLGD